MTKAFAAVICFPHQLTVVRNELLLNTRKLAGSKKQDYWTLVQYGRVRAIKGKRGPYAYHNDRPKPPPRLRPPKSCHARAQISLGERGFREVVFGVVMSEKNYRTIKSHRSMVAAAGNRCITFPKMRQEASESALSASLFALCSLRLAPNFCFWSRNLVTFAALPPRVRTATGDKRR
jgi:hypothetical protein